jgi:hypothetical protein
VLAVGRLRQDARHLLPAQDLGQLRRGLGARDGEVHPLAPERGVVEEAQAVGDEAARVPREPALFGQMHEVRLDLALREPVRRSAVELGQTGDGGQVGLARALGQAAHDHVVVHSISKRAHDALGGAAKACGNAVRGAAYPESMCRGSEARRAQPLRDGSGTRRASGLVQLIMTRESPSEPCGTLPPNCRPRGGGRGGSSCFARGCVPRAGEGCRGNTASLAA